MTTFAIRVSVRRSAVSRWPSARLLAVATLLAAVGTVTPCLAQGRTKLNVVMNFSADGISSPLFLALERGYYRDAGLDVEIEPSKGSADAITRVASGASDVGVGDLSTLIEFASRRPEVSPKAIFMLFNTSPLAVISFKTANITKLKDLEGKKLGQGPADAPAKMFPAVARIAGLDMSKIEIKQFSPQIRDTMLLTKQVDAVTGFDSTTLFNLKSNGVKLDDCNVIYYSDNGLSTYGNAVLANNNAIKTKFEALRSFVRATSRAYKESAKDPKPAIDALLKHNNLVKADIEQDRLEWFIAHQVITPETKREGIGHYDQARLVDNIARVAESFELSRKPTVEEIYDDRFMPPKDERMPLM